MPIKYIETQMTKQKTAIKHLTLTEGLYAYLLGHSLNEHAVLEKIRHDNLDDPLATMMQIAPEQGQFMAFLVKLLNVKNIIEVGTSTGYSSLAMALALPDDGKLISCDINEVAGIKAQHYWQLANVADKIQLKLAPAIETLQALEATHSNSFDLAFIDADKIHYDDYFEACLSLLKPNGLILIDNVLWGGAVIDKKNNQADTLAIRALNKKLCNDKRIELCMLPIADGLSLVRKI